MPDLQVVHDGRIAKSVTTNWDDAHDATSGTAYSNGTRDFLGIYASKTSGRFGGVSIRVYRYFFEFDTEDITVTPTAASVKIRGVGGVTGDIIAVKTTQSSPPVNGDFDAITGWDNDADNTSNVTAYSNELALWTNSGWNSIALNSTALSDMASLDSFKFALINHTYDLSNTDPNLGTTESNGLYLSEWTSQAYGPYIDYTEGAAGYTPNVSGTDTIAKVIGVETIEKVIGV
jgi:hypothetical protein